MLVGSNVIALSALVNFPGVVRAKACPESIGSLLWFGQCPNKGDWQFAIVSPSASQACPPPTDLWVWRAKRLPLVAYGIGFFCLGLVSWWLQPKKRNQAILVVHLEAQTRIFPPWRALIFGGLRTARQASSPFLMWTGH